MPNDYYHTKESVNEYIQLAKDVNGQELITKLHKVLPGDSTVLELGTGPGTDWQLLSEFYTVTGSDLSVVFLNHLKATFPHGEFIELDATTIKTTDRFNGIYANKVLHHLTDVELADSIKRQYEILKDGGVVCLSFWSGEGSEIFKGMFVNYHETAGLIDLFQPLFEILSLESYAEFEADDSLLLIARKKSQS